MSSPPRSAADELASPGSSFLSVAADAQPLFTMQIDSHDVEVTTAVTTVKDHRLVCAGDQDDDASPGHAAASTDDQIGLRGVSSSLDGLPNEILLHVLGFLDVSDVLATSRVSVAPFFFFRRISHQNVPTAFARPLSSGPPFLSLSQAVSQSVSLSLSHSLTD